MIEFLIYIALVGIILSVSGGIGLNVLNTSTKVSSITEVSQNARFAIGEIESKVSKAVGINTPSAGTTSTTLSLQMSDSAVNPTIFDLSNGILRIKEGAGSVIPITSDEVSVSSLNFANYSYANTAGTVSISLTIAHINPENKQEYNVEETFNTTVNIQTPSGYSASTTPPTPPPAGDQADDLTVDVSNASLNGNGKEVQGITLENAGSQDIVIDKIEVTWDNGEEIEEIKIDNTKVWSKNGPGTPEGKQSSGTELDIQDVTMIEGGGVLSINKIKFDKDMEGATLNMIFTMGDATLKTVSNIQP